MSKCEVLIIGAGPSGASAAYWLAKAGIDVTVIEKKTFPREKTCGDGLTPRSVYQLEAMGLGNFLATQHRYDGLRAVAFGKEMELKWPYHEELPSYGYIVTRYDLDQAVSQHAAKAGAKIIEGAEATGTTTDSSGKITGITIQMKSSGEKLTMEPTYVIIADGSNSRIGRSLGVTRDRNFPMGLAIRGYFSSPGTFDPYIESHLDIRTKQGEVLPGYGWIFPLGDGRVNVGIGLLSTAGRWKEVNTTKMMEAFVESAPKRWELSLDDPIYKPTGGKLPMGFSLGPRRGPNYLIVGDASGAINPFNGEGIAYGYETGRIAADVVGDAIRFKDPTVLARYERSIDDKYGDYYRVARVFVALIGKPIIMRTAVSVGMRSRTIMTPLVRIMANLMRDNENGVPELAYKAGLTIVKSLEWWHRRKKTSAG